jgi:hypothetical protein
MLSRWTAHRGWRSAPFVLIVSAVFAMSSSAPAASSAPVAASARAKALKSSQSVKLINAFRARSDESGTLVSPPPPGQPNRANGNTKHTTRLWGSDPFQEAVAVTQLVYPAEGPTGLDTAYPDDRPRAITLLTPDEELTAITATPLIHFPDNAPVMYVTHDGIPAVTLREIQRLKPVGIGRYNDVQAFVVGAANNPGVIGALQKLGLKYKTVNAPDPATLANQVDQIYGSIQNPDLGYPIMSPTATGEGSSIADVVIGSTAAPQYLLPATHWVSHMPTGLLWVTPEGVPQATIEALKRREGDAQIYVYGGPNVVSPSIVRQLRMYGHVSRVSEDDGVAYNTPPPNTPLTTSVAFAKMWDPVGMMGWNITGAGHGFTLVNESDWQGAVGSAILSHLGFHAPLLFTNDSNTLPSALDGYFKSVAPTFLVTPADGPYNMTYVIGSYNSVSWHEQTQIDHDSGMANRRDPEQTTGSGYITPR